MAVNRLDCLCAGIVVADHVCAPVERLPGAGELVLTDRMDLTIGGCAANVAVGLARLGAGVEVAGTVGRDVFGRFVREALTAAGVGCGLLVDSETAHTSGTFVINVRGEDRRFVHSVGANAEFTSRDLPAERVRACRVLYLGGYGLSDEPTAENVAGLFRMAREAGAATVLDVALPGPGDHWSKLRPILPWTDVFLPNDDEARLITGRDDPLAQALEFREAGANTVVITRGRNGAVLVDERRRIQAGRYPVEFVDGTGSGDAFAAGYIHGLLQGRDTLDCLRSGSALGASCVRATGATTGLLTAEELHRFLQSHELPLTELSETGHLL